MVLLNFVPLTPWFHFVLQATAEAVEAKRASQEAEKKAEAASKKQREVRAS